MRVVVSSEHLRLKECLVEESNELFRDFNNKVYSRIENVDNILFKYDISVEKKKSILIKRLHDSILKTFSVDKKKFTRKTLELLRKRLDVIRRIIIKLRNLNYYLETTFLEELKTPKIKKTYSPRLNLPDNLAKDELEALEYITYKLIEDTVSLDKQLLKEYSTIGKRLLIKEREELKYLDLVLRKESSILEHLEAKLPPPKEISTALIKEPVFTHWVARVLALLSYLEYVYNKEKILFRQLKKNNVVRQKINMKIVYLIKEKAELLKILDEKYISIKKFSNSQIRQELHKYTILLTL